MERTEITKRLFFQAKKLAVLMGAAVVAYGVAGYFLIKTGHAGPLVLDARTCEIAKYAALAASAAGIFGMRQLGARITAMPQGHPQKLFVKTLLMCAAAELPLLLGLLLVYFGRQIYDYIPFAILSLVGFALAFPHKQQWVNWLGADF